MRPREVLRHVSAFLCAWKGILCVKGKCSSLIHLTLTWAPTVSPPPSQDSVVHTQAEQGLICVATGIQSGSEVQ